MHTNKPKHDAHTTEHVSPDVFLSQHQVRYDRGFPTTDPAVIVAALKVLNSTRTLDTETGDLVDTVFQNPSFHHTTAVVNPSKALTDRVNHARQLYLGALKTGNVSKVHAAVVELDAVLMELGGTEATVPPSDFAIIAEGDSVEAEIARTITSLRTELHRLDVEELDGSEWDGYSNDKFPAHNLLHPVMLGGEPQKNSQGAVIGLWDTPAFFQALNTYTL